MRQELGLQTGRRERWVNLAGFLLCCGAMVMPRRMGEGGREKKGKREGSARTEELGACGEEGRDQHL